MKGDNVISVEKFEEQCLTLLDNLDTEGLTITRHGQPIARVIPYPSDPGALIGSLKGKIAVHGELNSTGLNWDANGPVSDQS